MVDASEAQSSDSTTRNCHIFAQHFNARLLLPSLETLLPGEAAQEEQWKDQGPLSRNGQFEANFLRVLTFSAVNGFAGLGRIPISTVPKFLARYGNVGDLLMRILKASPHHVAKALAENISKPPSRPRKKTSPRCSSEPNWWMSIRWFAMLPVKSSPQSNGRLSCRMKL